MIRGAAVNKRMQVGPLTMRHVSGFRVPILIFAPMGWGRWESGAHRPLDRTQGENQTAAMRFSMVYFSYCGGPPDRRK